MPKLTDSYKEINKYIAALSGSGLGNAQAFAQMAGGWDGKYTRDKADELGAWIRQNYATPDNIAQLTKARDKYSQPGEDFGGDDWVSERKGLMASNRAWVSSDDYKALQKAQNEYDQTPAGREAKAYNALFNALSDEAYQEHTRKLDNDMGWIGKRAEDATDFWGKYGLPITASLMSMGMGSAAAGAMQAAGYGSTAAGAVGGATSGAVNSAVQGNSIGKGALTGGLLGGLGGAMSGTNMAANMGVENTTGQGFVNGAIKGGVTSALKGGSVSDGLLKGAIGGGVQAFNPSESLGLDNKYGQGLANNAIAGLLQGKDAGSVLGSATQGALSGALSGKFGSLADAKAWATNNLLPGSAGDGGGGDEGSNQEGGSGMDDDIYQWIADNFGDYGSGSGGDDSFVLDPSLLENTFNTVNQSNAAWLAQNPWYSSLSDDDRALWDSITAPGTPLDPNDNIYKPDSGWLNKIGNWLNSSSGIGKNGTMGGALAALLGTGLGAASGGGNETSTRAFQMDPRMDPFVYGDQGYLKALQSKFNANPSGINPLMQQALDIGTANLTDPAYGQTYRDMRDFGSNLLSAPLAGNPFTTPQTQPGGLPGASGGPSWQMPAGVPVFQGAGTADSLIQRGQGLLTAPGAQVSGRTGGGLLSNFNNRTQPPVHQAGGLLAVGAPALVGRPPSTNDGAHHMMAIRGGYVAG